MLLQAGCYTVCLEDYSSELYLLVSNAKIQIHAKKRLVDVLAWEVTGTEVKWPCIGWGFLGSVHYLSSGGGVRAEIYLRRFLRFYHWNTYSEEFICNFKISFGLEEKILAPFL